MKKLILAVICLLLISSGAFAGNGDLIVDGKLGVGTGTATPSTELEVIQSLANTQRGITSSGYGDITNAAVFGVKRARGTVASPTKLQSSDNVMSLQSWGYDGSSFLRTAFINTVTEGNISTGTLPQAIIFGTGTNGAGSERMRITSAGKVGIGTSNPAFNLDISGNINITGSYFINGSALTPLSSFGGTNYIPKYSNATSLANSQIYDTGTAVGIGATAPAATLHVYKNGNQATTVMAENPDSTDTNSYASFSSKADTANMIMLAHGSARTVARYGITLGGYSELVSYAGKGLVIGTGSTATPIVFGANNLERMRITSDGYVGIGTATPANPLQVGTDNTNGNGAYLSAGGVWTDGSSRDFKENIQSLSADTAIDTMRNLNPVTYAYKVDPAEKHVGFIAEDVPDLVATQDRKHLSPMDIVAVLTKVVQEQQKEIEQLKSEMVRLKAKDTFGGVFTR